MDERIRISDADRERVTEKLREHFADGRLGTEELDERISATLSAKTYADLRRIMADLPGDAPVPVPVMGRPWPGPRGAVVRRGPRLLPLAIIALIAAVALPGIAWLFLAFLKVLLVIWLAACIAGVVALFRFRRRMRRFWQSGQWQSSQYWQQFQWNNPR